MQDKFIWVTVCDPSQACFFVHMKVLPTIAVFGHSAWKVQAFVRQSHPATHFASCAKMCLTRKWTDKLPQTPRQFLIASPDHSSRKSRGRQKRWEDVQQEGKVMSVTKGCTPLFTSSIQHHYSMWRPASLLEGSCALKLSFWLLTRTQRASEDQPGGTK